MSKLYKIISIVFIIISLMMLDTGIFLLVTAPNKEPKKETSSKDLATSILTDKYNYERTEIKFAEKLNNDEYKFIHTSKNNKDKEYIILNVKTDKYYTENIISRG